MPFAILVSQMMMRGFCSEQALAASKAWTRASMSLPSTRWTCQPKDSKRDAAGSKPVTCEAGPSACWLLTSTMAIRLSSF